MITTALIIFLFWFRPGFRVKFPCTGRVTGQTLLTINISFTEVNGDQIWVLPALCLSFQVFLSNSLFVTESTSLSQKHRLNRAKLSRNLKLINRANIVNRKLTYLTDSHRNKGIIMPYHLSMRQLKLQKVSITQSVQSALFCATVLFIPN